jgi:hypothetical protein
VGPLIATSVPRAADNRNCTFLICQ